jgi:hypothetical protein
MYGKRMAGKTKELTQIVGVENWINQETGEVKEFSVIKKSMSSDYNFHKVWLSDILSVLDNFGNKKLKILSHLLSKMRNEDNSVTTTYRMIEENTGISLPTITLTMNELIKANVLKKQCSGNYTFNPSLLVKGNSDKRKRLLIEYIYEDDKKQTKIREKQEVIENILKLKNK